MMSDSRRAGPLVSVVALLFGLALIAVGVYSRDMIGNFASWLLVSAAMVIAIAIPALRRRHTDKPLE